VVFGKNDKFSALDIRLMSELRVHSPGDAP
jgi:hypothetical protein